jgi:hypothetical protein
VTVNTQDLQRIYVDIHSKRFKDFGLISTIDSYVNKARFVLTQQNIQFNTLGNPVWVNWTSHYTDQVMRFSRDEPIVVRIMEEEGNTLRIADNIFPIPPDPSLQTWVYLEVMPYFLDAKFVNQGINQAVTQRF